MHVRFCTLPGTFTDSRPPDMLPPAYDTAQLLSTTNTTRAGDPTPEWPYGEEKPELWQRAEDEADRRECDFMGDAELYPAMLAQYVGDRPLFAKNLDKRRRMLSWTKGKVRRGFYNCSMRGIARGFHSLRDYREYRKAERDALPVDFDIIEGSAQEPENGGGEAGALVEWQHNLDFALAEADASDAVVLIYPDWATRSGRAKSWSAASLRHQFRACEREGVTPAVWNPTPAVCDVAREVSAVKP